MERLQPSEKLAAILGDKRVSQVQVFEGFWGYIRENGLQDARNPRWVKADENLGRIFGGQDQVTALELSRLAKPHVFVRGEAKQDSEIRKPPASGRYLRKQRSPNCYRGPLRTVSLFCKREERMNQAIFISGVCLLLAAGPAIGTDCENWNTEELLKTATVDEVIGCLQAGVDPNAHNKRGNTPLHEAAAWNKDPSVITALLHAGADLNGRNKIGSTPSTSSCGVESESRRRVCSPECRGRPQRTGR